MSTMPITLGDNSLNNAGKPVIGNTGVANPNKTAPPSAVPTSGVRPVLGSNTGGLISGNPILTSPMPTPVPVSSPASVINNAGGSGGAVPTNSPNAPAVTDDEHKQLTDIYGKGTGNLLASEISNLGSNDSTYMEAYKKAMARTNAENLATLNTILGNEGIGADSSTAAIENADFMTGVTSQEGLQEQQLQMNDLAQLLGLTSSTMSDSKDQVASGGIMNDIGMAISALPVIGGIGKAISHAGGGIPTVDGSGGSNPLGLNAPGTMDLSNLADAGSGADLASLFML